MRIGHGYDVHRFEEDRKLILGGVSVPYSVGLMGHSDADVVCHAVSDAILGAVCMGDIGSHFPDSDERYKGADSLKLLKEVGAIAFRCGYVVGNIDVTVVAQQPKLSPYIRDMRQNIASVLMCDVDRVNVKATTEEGLGFTGEMRGIACHAVCLMEEKSGAARILPL